MILFLMMQKIICGGKLGKMAELSIGIILLMELVGIIFIV